MVEVVVVVVMRRVVVRVDDVVRREVAAEADAAVPEPLLVLGLVHTEAPRRVTRGRLSLAVDLDVGELWHLVLDTG